MNDKLFGKLSNVDYFYQSGIKVWSGKNTTVLRFLGRAWRIETYDFGAWPESRIFS